MDKFKIYKINKICKNTYIKYLFKKIIIYSHHMQVDEDPQDNKVKLVLLLVDHSYFYFPCNL